MQFYMMNGIFLEEVPSKRDLEGWRPAIKNKCKEAFFRMNSWWSPLVRLGIPEGLLTDMDILTAFFDRWWDAEEAHDIEIEAGCWKTRGAAHSRFKRTNRRL